MLRCVMRFRYYLETYAVLPLQYLLPKRGCPF
jgi:hypothetical protein